jgi:hypothetical protein
MLVWSTYNVRSGKIQCTAAGTLICLVKLLASRFIKRGSNLIKLSGPRMAVCTLDPPTKGIKTREQGMRSCPAAATCQNQKAAANYEPAEEKENFNLWP